jgi:RNA polymerase sigma-70 factor (ECF subfamily)
MSFRVRISSSAKGRAKTAPRTDAHSNDVELRSNQILAKLVTDHQAGIWRYLRALGCRPELADDLTQETFLAALRRPFAYRGQAAAASYLRRSAYHRYVTYLKSIEATEELRDAVVAGATWGKWKESKRSDEDILFIMKECLQLLPERARKALEMRFRDGRSRQEIAAELAMSEHGAKNLMQRAKKQLRLSIETRIRAQAGSHATAH